ncbi:unnamed protein product [Phyllotreta striolata]|uniref:RING-type E3 ubiquitin transferase BRCA1 n=1 Tax=Phyllotreta striolata TaxID=444603 RepID=A0A9N9XSC6_PHYSR|nr:unnamed protein product [Phyllotreta striolata]
MNQEELVALGNEIITIKHIVKCPICLESIKTPVQLVCGHILCVNCHTDLKATKNQNCPLCKTPVKRRSPLYDDEFFGVLGTCISKICTIIENAKELSIEQIVRLDGTTKKFHDDQKLEFPAISQESGNDNSQCTPKNPFDKLVGAPKKLHFNKKGTKIKYIRKKKENDCTDCKVKILEFENDSNKASVLQWLNDNRNAFDRNTQTQTCDETGEEPKKLLSLDLPSVSQMNRGFPDEAAQPQILKTYRSRSLDNYCSSEKEITRLSDGVFSENYRIEENTEDILNKIEVMLENRFLNQLDSELDIKHQSKQKDNPPTFSVSSGWDRIEKTSQTLRKKGKTPEKLNIISHSVRKDGSCVNQRNSNEGLKSNSKLAEVSKDLSGILTEAQCNKSMDVPDETENKLIANVTQENLEHETVISTDENLKQKSSKRNLNKSFQNIIEALNIKDVNVAKSNIEETDIAKEAGEGDDEDMFLLQNQEATVGDKMEESELPNTSNNCVQHTEIDRKSQSEKSNTINALEEEEEDKSKNDNWYKKINILSNVIIHKNNDEKSIPQIASPREVTKDAVFEKNVTSQISNVNSNLNNIMSTLDKLHTNIENINRNENLTKQTLDSIQKYLQKLLVIPDTVRNKVDISTQTDQCTCLNCLPNTHQTEADKLEHSFLAAGTQCKLTELLITDSHKTQMDSARKDSQKFSEGNPIGNTLDLMNFETQALEKQYLHETKTRLPLPTSDERPPRCTVQSSVKTPSNLSSTSDNKSLSISNDANMFVKALAKNLDANTAADVQKALSASNSSGKRKFNRLIQDELSVEFEPTQNNSNNLKLSCDSEENDDKYLNTILKKFKSGNMDTPKTTDKENVPASLEFLRNKNETETTHISQNALSVVEKACKRSDTTSLSDLSDIIPETENYKSLIKAVIVDDRSSGEARRASQPPAQNGSNKNSSYCQELEDSFDGIDYESVLMDLEHSVKSDKISKEEDIFSEEDVIETTPHKEKPTLNKRTGSCLAVNLTTNFNNLDPSHASTPRSANPNLSIGLSPILTNKTLVEEASKTNNTLKFNKRHDSSQRNILTSDPRQKSILNYVKGSNEAGSKQTVCIACTRLGKDQLQSIAILTNKKLATYSASFDSSVTHMIVATDSRRRIKDYTLKLVTAVASGLWVLDFQWIQDCLRSNKLVPEKPYEVFDDAGGSGPKIARLTRHENPLFVGYKFYFVRPAQSMKVEDAEDIVIKLGGTVVRNLESLLAKDQKVKLIITEGKHTQDFEIYEKWLEKYKLVTVDIEWFSKSIGRYTVLSIRPYIWCSDDTLESLDYPAFLIENTGDQSPNTYG